MTARIQVSPEARRGDVVDVRIVIQHPMETGFRYDSLGRRTPRNVIHTLVCRYGGTEVFRAEMGAGIAGRVVERGARVLTSLAGRSGASADSPTAGRCCA